MDTSDCKLERVSNVTVGSVLLVIGLLATLIGFMIVPFIGLLFTLPLVIAGGIFLLAPRSKACSIIAEKTRGALKS